MQPQLLRRRAPPTAAAAFLGAAGCCCCCLVVALSSSSSSSYHPTCWARTIAFQPQPVIARRSTTTATTTTTTTSIDCSCSASARGSDSSRLAAAKVVHCEQLLGANRNPRNQQQQAATATTAASPSPPPTPASSRIRTGTTAADAYFRAHGTIPRPKVMHAVLPLDNSPAENQNGNNDNSNDRRGILIIGDVHGCRDELLRLHETAVQQHNRGRAFRHVLLVGDLVNKGPRSVAAIRHVRRHQPQWRAVRGNHDDGALRAALGDPEQRGKEKYQWTGGLSDEDVEFLAELPYTLRIPKELLQSEEDGDDGGDDLTVNDDVLIVHAGLIPGVPLEQQSIETMVTLREVEINEDSGVYRYYRKQKGRTDQQQQHQHPAPWASVWKGPERVVFGHDARRGLQQYDWATGLDTGVCYGKKLTGLILPGNKLVQVDALDVHCPISTGGQED